MKFRTSVAVFALTFASAAPALAAEIVPHEAVYRLTLKDMRLDGWSDTAGGILQLKISRDCHFWMLDRKLEFRVKFTDGRRTHMVVNEKVRESLDGDRFWFWSRSTINGGTASIIAGEAARLIKLEPEEPKIPEGPQPDMAENEGGPTLEDLVATPEELAKKAAEEAARKAEEEAKAAKAGKDGKEKKTDPKKRPDVAKAGSETDGKEAKQEGEAVKAAEVGAVEKVKDADAAALAEAEADAKAVAEKKPAVDGEKPEADSKAPVAVLLDENGNPVAQDQGEEGRIVSVVSYAWPDAEDVEIPLETIFPFAAMRSQLDALANGALQRSFTIFDGSSPSGALRVLYRPVRSLAVSTIKPKGNVELLDTTSWRYSATFMRADGTSKRPARIVISQIHENGVVSEMLLDVGAFSIRGDLAWIKSTQLPACG